MNPYFAPTMLAGVITAVALVFAAMADGMPGAQSAAVPPAAQAPAAAASVAGCATPEATAAGTHATVADASGATGTVSDAGAQPAAAPAAAAEETPLQTAERWRDEATQWFDNATRNLVIEHRYPVDVESEPHPFGAGPGSADEA